MIVDIRERLDARPFVPFTIHVADGRQYRVERPDDAHVHSNRARASVFTDDGREFILPALLISGIGVDPET
jgi:hypothetical protein